MRPHTATTYHTWAVGTGLYSQLLSSCDLTYCYLHQIDYQIYSVTPPSLSNCQPTAYQHVQSGCHCKRVYLALQAVLCVTCSSLLSVYSTLNFEKLSYYIVVVTSASLAVIALAQMSLLSHCAPVMLCGCCNCNDRVVAVIESVVLAH